MIGPLGAWPSPAYAPADLPTYSSMSSRTVLDAAITVDDSEHGVGRQARTLDEAGDPFEIETRPEDRTATAPDSSMTGCIRLRPGSASRRVPAETPRSRSSAFPAHADRPAGRLALTGRSRGTALARTSPVAPSASRRLLYERSSRNASTRLRVTVGEKPTTSGSIARAGSSRCAARVMRSSSSRCISRTQRGRYVAQRRHRTAASRAIRRTRG